MFTFGAFGDVVFPLRIISHEVTGMQFKGLICIEKVMEIGPIKESAADPSHTPGLTELERLAGPPAPRPGMPHHKAGHLHAVHCVLSDACPRRTPGPDSTKQLAPPS